jgi:hypothetical protein
VFASVVDTQGIMFSVLWRLGQDYLNKKDAEKAAQDKAEAEAVAAATSSKKK